MNNHELLPHLFRTEYRKIASVLSRRFGFEHLEIAEDITSDTFLTATQSWGLEGIPENPTAWLYQVAKNKAMNFLQRQKIFNEKITIEIGDTLYTQTEPEVDLSPKNINDSQLQMIFAICHPSISKEAQIGLSLRILCGFGIAEIANAFLTNKETINKRLFRAREILRREKIETTISSDQLTERLPAVLRTIYLLFNEGYYSIIQDTTLRKDFCLEALRLCTMLVENTSTNTSDVNALLALMCFHLSRFDARVSGTGDIILYDEQDSSLWNTDLISKGGYFLKQAAVGDRLTTYHLEAALAYWNTQKPDTKEKWDNILYLYDELLQLEYSPIAALNRIYALSKAIGKRQALVEAKKLTMIGNQFYFALLGELYTDIDNVKALLNFQEAIALAQTTADKMVLQKKVAKINRNS